MTRPRLTYQGSDVGLCRRTAEGKALVVYLDRNGEPTCHCVEVWPHQLRGLGWHLAEIKARIAQLPLVGAALAPPDTAAPRPLLFAHHAAPKD